MNHKATTPESSPFNLYSRYYYLLYTDKDYAAETEYIHSLLTRHGVQQGNLLEFGSGTGRHGRLLAEKGFRVHGIERSAEMVALATPSAGFDSEQGDICTVRLHRRFDAVLALFHVVSYQVSNRDVEAVFDSAAFHLEPGGLFLFDVWYSPAVYTQKPGIRVKRLSGDGVRLTRIAEPVIYHNQNRVDVNYTIFAESPQGGLLETFSETHSMRHFSLPELDCWAARTGMERIAAEEFLTGKEAGDASWGVCLVMRKT